MLRAITQSCRPAVARQISLSLPRAKLPYACAPHTKAFSLSPEALWKIQSDNALKYLPKPPGPYAGRTVAVRDGAVAEAYNRLMRRLRGNNMWREIRSQSRHEKKGVKRRRLRSVRWRRRFAAEVRKNVQLVKAIRLRRG
ncbi:hypothetical protein PLICRDRAFT_628097 [Plicaturopsis crispa FD-325 SS-3]|nr:hypothetical protein PLICRDRAFT_628097 [Plicaturopsis crispa FD-325 SS-3]